MTADAKSVTSQHSLPSQLLPQQQAIIAIAAFTAKGDMPALETALQRGLNDGMSVQDIKEVLLQMYAYTGFPRSLNAINQFMAVVKARREQGIEDTPGVAPHAHHDGKSTAQRGAEIQTLIAGRPLVAEKGNFIEFLPEINDFLQQHLFADIIARDNLSFIDREIATISALAALGKAEGQLRSHINGGLNVGLTAAQIEQVFDVYRQCVNADDAAVGFALLNEVRVQRVL